MNNAIHTNAFDFLSDVRLNCIDQRSEPSFRSVRTDRFESAGRPDKLASKSKIAEKSDSRFGGPLSLLPSAGIAFLFVVMTYLLGILTFEQGGCFLLGSWSAHLIATLHTRANAPH